MCVDFLHYIQSSDLKILHKNEPDNLKLDYNHLSAIELGIDEDDMNRHGKLLCILWNSRPKGYQSENEKKYLRQGILNNGMLRHCFPWIAHDVELAGLQDLKFLPMETANHNFNWFDKQHFEFNEFELCRIQPLTLGQSSIHSGSCSRCRTPWRPRIPGRSNIFRPLRRLL